MKFSTKKKDTEKIEHVARQSRNFEISLSDMARKSERRAWWVAAASLLVTILLICGYIGLVPLKEKVPYLVMADPYTGTSTVARLSDKYLNETITQSEAINKSNIARFVTARESYDWDLISRHDWNVVNAMGESAVVNEYRKLFAPTNPANPDKLYGQKYSVRVKIKTIILKVDPATKEGGSPQFGAEIWFDRIVIDKQAVKITKMDSFIAKMECEYKLNLAMSDDLRLENPLGFRVKSYEITRDGGGSGVSTAVLGDLENIQQVEPVRPQVSSQPAGVTLPPAGGRSTVPPAAAAAQPSAAPAPAVAQPSTAPAQAGGTVQ